MGSTGAKPRLHLGAFAIELVRVDALPRVAVEAVLVARGRWRWGRRWFGIPLSGWAALNVTSPTAVADPDLRSAACVGVGVDARAWLVVEAAVGSGRFGRGFAPGGRKHQLGHRPACWATFDGYRAAAVVCLDLCAVAVELGRIDALPRLPILACVRGQRRLENAFGLAALDVQRARAEATNGGVPEAGHGVGVDALPTARGARW